MLLKLKGGGDTLEHLSHIRGPQQPQDAVLLSSSWRRSKSMDPGARRRAKSPALTPHVAPICEGGTVTGPASRSSKDSVSPCPPCVAPSKRSLLLLLPKETEPGMSLGSPPEAVRGAGAHPERSEALPLATAWTSLGNMTPSGRSQTQRPHVA